MNLAPNTMCTHCCAQHHIPGLQNQQHSPVMMCNRCHRPFEPKLLQWTQPPAAWSQLHAMQQTLQQIQLQLHHQSQLSSLPVAEPVCASFQDHEADKQQQLQSLEVSNTKAKDALDKANALLKEMHGSISILRGDLACARSDVQHLKNVNGTLAKATAKAKGATSKANEMRASITTFQRDLARAKSDVKYHQKLAITHVNSTGAVTKENVALKKRLGEVTQQASRWKERATKAERLVKNNVKALQKLLQTHAQELETQILDGNTREMELRRKLTPWKDLILDLGKQLNIPLTSVNNDTQQVQIMSVGIKQATARLWDAFRAVHAFVNQASAQLHTPLKETEFPTPTALDALVCDLIERGKKVVEKQSSMRNLLNGSTIMYLPGTLRRVTSHIYSALQKTARFLQVLGSKELDELPDAAASPVNTAWAFLGFGDGVEKIMFDEASQRRLLAHRADNYAAEQKVLQFFLQRGLEGIQRLYLITNQHLRMFYELVFQYCPTETRTDACLVFLDVLRHVAFFDPAFINGWIRERREKKKDIAISDKVRGQILATLTKRQQGDAHEGPDYLDLLPGDKKEFNYFVQTLEGDTRVKPQEGWLPDNNLFQMPVAKDFEVVTILQTMVAAGIE